MRLPLLFASSVFLLAACTAQPVPPGEQGSSSSASQASSANVKLLQTGHFSAQYPDDWTAKSNVTMPEAGYETLGTLLTYPADKDRTTLTSAGMHLAYGSGCPDLKNIESVGSPDTVTIGGKQWTHYVRDGVGAGNRYQGDTYVYQEPGACYLISTLEHSCNLGPDCGENHSAPFDKKAMDALFGTVVSSFSFRQ